MMRRDRFVFRHIVGNHLDSSFIILEDGFKSVLDELILSILSVVCVIYINDISFVGLQLLLQESGQVNLAYKAYAL